MRTTALLNLILLAAFPWVEAQEKGVDQYGTELHFDLVPGPGEDLSSETLIERLRSVIIVDSVDDLVVSESPKAEPGVHSTMSFSPKDAVSPYLNKPVSPASLDAMVKGMIRAFRDEGMEIVDLLIPEQRIANGIVQLLVIPQETTKD